MTSRSVRIREGSARLRSSTRVLGPEACPEATGCPEIGLGETAAIRRSHLFAHRVIRRIGRSCLGLLVGFAVLALTVPTIDRISHSIAMFCADQAQQSFDDGKFAPSAAYLKRALNIEPGNAVLHHMLARTEEKLGDHKESLSEYHRAIQLDPNFYDAYIDLAAVYADKLHDFPSSLHVLEEALHKHPDVPTRYAVYTGIGKSDLGVGDLNSAQRALIQAIQVDPARGAAHCLLAQVLDLKGHEDQASSEWGSCAAMSNQSDVEHRWLVSAERRLSRPLRP